MSDRQNSKGSTGIFYLRVILSFLVFFSFIVAIIIFAESIKPNMLILKTAPLYLTLWGVVGSVTAVLYSIYRRFARRDYGWDHFITGFFRIILGGLFATISFFVVVVILKSLPGKVGEVVTAELSKSNNYEKYKEALFVRSKAQADYDVARAERESVLASAELTEAEEVGTESVGVEYGEVRALGEKEEDAAKRLAKAQEEVEVFGRYFESAKVDGSIQVLKGEIEGVKAEREKITDDILKLAERPPIRGEERVAPELESRKLRILELDAGIKKLESERAGLNAKIEKYPPRKLESTPRPADLPKRTTGKALAFKGKVEERQPEEIGRNVARLDVKLSQLKVEKDTLEREIVALAEESGPGAGAAVKAGELQNKKAKLTDELAVKESEVGVKEKERDETSCQEEERAEQPPWKDPVFVLIAIIAGFFIDFVPRKLETLRDSFLEAKKPNQ